MEPVPPIAAPDPTRRPAVIATPHDLARQLAGVARQLQATIAEVLTDGGPHGPLYQQCVSLRQMLHPTLTPGAVADMVAQTIVYSLFAARVAAPDCPDFSRHDVAHALPTSAPPLRDILALVAGPALDTPLAVLVDTGVSLLAHTDMAAVLECFGQANGGHRDAVMHFYETFLAAYAPRTREMCGVYYTPGPVVGYIVRSVDHLLHTHFARPAGLADHDTVILDPATGTGTFLYAVVQHIHQTVAAGGQASTWSRYVPESLLPRLHGFEVLLAPYTIAHLQLGRLLSNLGYSFAPDERLAISLDNALTTPSLSPGVCADAGETRPAPVLVVLGNPPYANSGPLNRGAWIQAQLEAYKRGLHEKKHHLDDDFIKFMRLGQWHIEQAGQGILAFITNNTYLDGITHRRMRESLLETFTHLYLLDLHGGALKKAVAPDGSPDDNVFDIRQGVAIGIFVKEPRKRGPARVYHAEMWGRRASKYGRLSEESAATTAWEEICPTPPWYFFVPRPVAMADEYHQCPSLTDIVTVYQNVIKTDRDSLFFDSDYATLAERMERFYSAAGLCDPFRTTYRVEDSSSYKILARRQKTAFTPHAIRRALYRPFDVQWLYYAPDITSRPAWEVMRPMLAGPNIALLGMRQYEYDVPDYGYVFVTEHITESRVFMSNRGGASIFPLYRYDQEQGGARRSNLCPAFTHDIAQRLGLRPIPEGHGNLQTTVGPEDIFHYLYALLHRPTYRARYAPFLKIDYPRIPLPPHRALFAAMAARGAALVDLHLLRLPGGAGAGGAGGAAILGNPDAQGITQQGVMAGPVEQVRYDAVQQRVLIASGQYFAGIDPLTWAVQIGGYAPLAKWLKDRKGYTLSSEEERHYRRMVVALRETRRLMAEIDALPWE